MDSQSQKDVTKPEEEIEEKKVEDVSASVPKKKYRVVRTIAILAVIALIFIAGLTIGRSFFSEEHDIGYNRRDTVIILRDRTNDSVDEVEIPPVKEEEKTRLSEAEAKKIALKAHEGSEFLHIQLLVIDDTYIYIVTLTNQENEIITVYIDAYTGVIINSKVIDE